MTTPAPLFAQAIPLHTPRPPYLTVTEYENAATGVDWSQLVPNGTRATQTEALKAIIARASAWADGYCRQVLAATRDRTAGRYRVQRDGRLLVPLRFTPVIAIAAVSVGGHMGDAAPMTDLTGCDLNESGGVLTVPAYNFANGTIATAFRGRGDGRRFVLVEYVNGYPNPGLTVDVAAGASSITVSSALAIFPGTQLTLADGGLTETVTVAATYTPTVVAGATVLPLTAPLTQAHTAGTAASAMPYGIKEAVILLATALVKTRGAEDFELPDLGQQVSKRGQSADSGLTEVDEAIDLLDPFRVPA